MATVLLILCAKAHAQVVPAAETGAASLNYALRYSQSATVGELGDQQRAMANGNVNYRNGNQRFPLSLDYAGGYTWNISGTDYIHGFNQHMAVSQGMIGHKWSLVGEENVSYYPTSPETTSFSGITGSGEPGGSGNDTSGETVLTVNTHSFNNFAGGTFERMINHSLSFTAGGGSNILRFSGPSGYNTDGVSANAGISDRLNARNSLVGQYAFSQYSFSGSGLSLQTDSFTVGLNRKWNVHFATSTAAGPQYRSSSNPAQIPSSTGIEVNASATYQSRLGSLSASYTRGISSGGGYLLGAEINSVAGNYARDFKRVWSLSVEGQYRRSTALTTNGSFSAEIGGVTATRRLNRRITLFGSYMALSQSELGTPSSSPTAPTSALNSLLNEFSVGIGYVPMSTHLRR